MKKVKFLHCADMHLDAPFTSLGCSEKISIRRQDLKAVFHDAVNRAKEENVELFLISGDLYEHNYVSKSTINFINDLFRSIPKISVFIIPGNHDPYIVNSFYKNFRWNENVYILTEDTPYVILDDIGVCVYGVGFRNFHEEKVLNYDIKPIDDSLINILLVHGTVDMNFSQNFYNPMNSENLAAAGMDYIGLGHFHNRIDDMGKYGVIYNPGSPEAMGFDEPGEHGVFLGTITKTDKEEKKLEIEFVTLGKRSYRSIELDVTGCCTNEQIIAKAEEALSNTCSGTDASKIKENLYSLTLKGYIEKGFKISNSQIQSYFSDKVFLMKLKDDTNIDYDFKQIMKEIGLRGVFTRKIFSLIDKTGDEYEKKLLMKALYYGLEALETGKVEIS